MEGESGCNVTVKQIKSALEQCNIKVSHKKWKALLKKEKRKLKRQEGARKREEEIDEEERKKENSPTYQAKQKELEEIENLKEQREEAERVYLNKLWEEKERIAQEEFQIQKEREAKEKERKLEIEKKIKEEWEERQRKEKEEEDKKEKKKEKQEELLKEATANENKDEPWHNPIATLLPGTERETCMFFSKTGACRFGERCSRGHPYPEISNTLMFSNMYNHFELEQGLKDDLDTTDVALEYDDGELYQNFQDFYNDIVPEFRNYGKVIQVKVCNNYEPHLRGNVYVQYKSENSAQEAFMNLNGRFYGGKQISGQFVEIRKWKSAICGLFRSGRCPKGRNCNFLHVFKNPNNEFWNADIDNPFESSESKRSRRRRSRSPHRTHRSSSRRTRRSRSPESQRYYSYECHSSRHSRSRSRSRERSYVRSRRKNKHSRSRTRSPETSQSRPRRERQSRSRSASQEREKSRLKANKRSNDSRSRSRSQSRSRKSRKRGRRSRSGSASNTNKQHQPTTGSEENFVMENKGKLENGQLPEDSVNGSNGSVNSEGKNLDFYANGDNTVKSDSPKRSVKKHKKHKKHKHKKRSNTVSDTD